MKSYIVSDNVEKYFIFLYYSIFYITEKVISMKTSEKVLQLLLKKQAFLSGQELADELNVSRTAVWKAIQSLQEEGYQIESKPRIGYRYFEGL